MVAFVRGSQCRFCSETLQQITVQHKLMSIVQKAYSSAKKNQKKPTDLRACWRFTNALFCHNGITMVLHMQICCGFSGLLHGILFFLLPKHGTLCITDATYSSVVYTGGYPDIDVKLMRTLRGTVRKKPYWPCREYCKNVRQQYLEINSFLLRAGFDVIKAYLHRSPFIILLKQRPV